MKLSQQKDNIGRTYAEEHSMSPSLPIHPPPHRGESLRGYLFRLAGENFYATPTWLNKLEPSLKKLHIVPEVINAVTRLAGLSREKQDFLRFPYGTDKLSAQFLPANARICPLCLKDDGLLDSMWEVSFACACPKHGILLKDSCEKCHSPISWNRQNMSFCHCGADLANGTTSEASQQVVLLNALIWKAAGRKVSQVETTAFPEKDLSKLSLGQICILYRFLAASVRGETKLNKAKSCSIEEALLNLEAIGKALTGWPEGFNQILVDQRKKGEGLQQAFGSLYRNLYKQLPGKPFGFVRNVFEKYINTNWDGIVDQKYRRLPQGKRKSAFIGTRQAAKMLDIGSGQLIKLIDQGIVSGKRQKRPSGRTLTSVSEADVKRYQKVLPHLLNGDETRKLLGVSKRHLGAFVDNGIIKPHVRPQVGSLSEWRFDARPIKKLLKEIQVIAPNRDAPTNAIPFMKVCQVHLPNQKALPAFFEAVKTGAVPVVGIMPGMVFSLALLCFEPEEIANFRDMLNEVQKNFYTIPKFALRLGVKQEVAYHLVNKGFFSYVASKGVKFKGRLVSEKSIKNFESKYISLAQVAYSRGASLRGAHLTVLKLSLSEAGVTPVTGPEIDGCRQLFYRKGDLPESFG